MTTIQKLRRIERQLSVEYTEGSYRQWVVLWTRLNPNENVFYGDKFNHDASKVQGVLCSCLSEECIEERIESF